MAYEFKQTDSRDVMEMAVTLYMTDQIWEQVARAIHSDDAERVITEIYDRVYKSVRTTHGS